MLFAACCAGLPWTEPGTRVWRAADALFPGGAPLYRRLVRALCLPVLALHAAEACYFDRRLRRHGVDRWSALWWRWASSCFVEGVMAFRRFDAVVARKTAAKDGGKML
ncbi:hypothetical protein CDD83_233 [Cordyceps sp. RAO-2017]|nr:hypothetical protein CDD83_233 [Cordyceps sp. RAO-2017]